MCDDTIVSKELKAISWISPPPVENVRAGTLCRVSTTAAVPSARPHSRHCSRKGRIAFIGACTSTDNENEAAAKSRKTTLASSVLSPRYAILPGTAEISPKPLMEVSSNVWYSTPPWPCRSTLSGHATTTPSWKGYTDRTPPTWLRTDTLFSPVFTLKAWRYPLYDPDQTMSEAGSKARLAEESCTLLLDTRTSTTSSKSIMPPGWLVRYGESSEPKLSLWEVYGGLR
mmetsp:Transcript_12773/g.33807  ORF Transcript_12773/g.33807 Transcript_12773/m.33807 type:complete len:228 (+) Transcript_12773:330-1013(+)